MRHTLGSLLRLLAVLLIVVAVWDALLFRSGLYYRWLEPKSTAGMTRSAIYLAASTYQPERRNVLVLGNSLMGEGFSATAADETTRNSDLHFINASIPGTDLRAWAYLLRRIDPRADRFAAVVVQVTYDPGIPTNVEADYALDVPYLTPLLGLRDLLDFPSSFDDPAEAARARRAILFPGQPLKNDIEAFLAAPAERIAELKMWRRHYVPAALHYGGRDASLPDLVLDPVTLQPVAWGDREAALKPMLSGYFAALRERPTAAVAASNERYFRQWLGRIAVPYRAHGIPVILVSVPRGPWHAKIPAPEPAGAVAELVAEGTVTTLPGDSFVDLEQPRYFFDSRHLNHEGRERFSPRLASAIAARLH